MTQPVSLRVVALVDDLMDRSRLAALEPITWASGPDGAVDADTVVVDLGRHAAAVGAVRRVAPDAFIVAFGPHVDGPVLEAARSAGADRVLARSRFFADPAAALARDDGAARA